MDVFSIKIEGYWRESKKKVCLHIPEYLLFMTLFIILQRIR